MKKITEQTSSGASGSFETPMGSGMVRRNFHPFFDIDSEEVQPKKKKKQLNKKKKQMKNLTISEIQNIVLKTLIHEEVYSEKPIEQKGKDISSKNAKSKVTTKTSKKIDDITSKSGKQSKSDVSGRAKKVSASLKNNLKGAEVKDVNKFKKVDYDYETEAYQNGMEDITYDRISDEQREKNTKYIKSAEMRKNPNAEKSGKAADKMIKQAKDREASRSESPYRNAQQMGGDIEFYDKQNQKNNGKKLIPRKKLGMNENTIKRLTFNNFFRDDKDMLRKIPSNYKQNDLVFEMYDGDSNYRVRWEGAANNGVGVILEHRSASKERKNLQMFENLNNFERLDFQPQRNVQSSTLNENQIFKQMLNQSRRLINEADGNILQVGKLAETSGIRMVYAPNATTTGVGMWRNIEDFSDIKSSSTMKVGAVPAPDSAEVSVDDYNAILSGKKEFDGEKYDYGVLWNSKTSVVDLNGKFILNPNSKTATTGIETSTGTDKGTETSTGTDKGTETSTGTENSTEVPTFANTTNETGFGMGMGRISDVQGAIKTVAAPDNNSITTDEYNKILSGEAPYDGTNKFNFKVKWVGKTPFTTKGSFVNIADKPSVITNFDNAYNYMKYGVHENGTPKVFVQKKGQGNVNNPNDYIYVSPYDNKAAYSAITSKVKFQ